MATPVVPSQFAVGKNRIVHRPTGASFTFKSGATFFDEVDWGRAGDAASGARDYRKDDIERVAQRLLMRLPR